MLGDMRLPSDLLKRKKLPPMSLRAGVGTVGGCERPVSCASDPLCQLFRAGHGRAAVHRPALDLPTHFAAICDGSELTHTLHGLIRCSE